MGVSIDDSVPGQPVARGLQHPPSSAAPCSGRSGLSTPRLRPTPRCLRPLAAQAGSGAGIYKMVSPGAAFGVGDSAAIFTARSVPTPRASFAWRRDHLRRTPDNLAAREAAIIALMFNVFMVVVAIIRSCSPCRSSSARRTDRFQGNHLRAVRSGFPAWRSHSQPGRSHRSARPGRFINRFQISIGSHHEHAL